MDVDPTEPSDHIDQPHEPVSAEIPQHEASESEAETEYNGPPSNGKMMRRSIGQAEPAPEGTLSVSESQSEDDEDEVDDATADEQEVPSDTPENEPTEVEDALPETVPVVPAQASPFEAPRRGRGRPRGAGKDNSRKQQTRKGQAESEWLLPCSIEEHHADILQPQ